MSSNWGIQFHWACAFGKIHVPLADTALNPLLSLVVTLLPRFVAYKGKSMLAKTNYPPSGISMCATYPASKKPGVRSDSVSK